MEIEKDDFELYYQQFKLFDLYLTVFFISGNKKYCYFKSNFQKRGIWCHLCKQFAITLWGLSGVNCCTRGQEFESPCSSDSQWWWDWRATYCPIEALEARLIIVFNHYFLFCYVFYFSVNDLAVNAVNYTILLWIVFASTEACWISFRDIVNKCNLKMKQELYLTDLLQVNIRKKYIDHKLKKWVTIFSVSVSRKICCTPCWITTWRRVLCLGSWSLAGETTTRSPSALRTSRMSASS